MLKPGRKSCIYIYLGEVTAFKLPTCQGMHCSALCAMFPSTSCEQCFAEGANWSYIDHGKGEVDLLSFELVYRVAS
jgi:hypothetical protein